MAWTTPRTWITGELATAALFNTHLRDNLNEFVGTGGWTNVTTLLNGWTISGTNRWTKRGPIVVYVGRAIPGTVSQPIFTYPAGARPTYEMLYWTQANRSAPSGNPMADLRVTSGGSILCHAGGLTGVELTHAFYAGESGS